MPNLTALPFGSLHHPEWARETFGKTQPTAGVPRRDVLTSMPQRRAVPKCKTASAKIDDRSFVQVSERYAVYGDAIPGPQLIVTESGNETTARAILV